ncbi:hypothetical protein EZV73_02855 [Acidaminobacter sp. JC074]|uniref:NAD(P)-binding domain-containing protein n=1 Tax=Acidaminobacter sp. JC074 TaxID=2530199 RepID=UPI001F0CF6D1|nr:NAD(P)-binding domain-containing protein [Acidaminobacter sp. JC074]MCH4886487.1 hypothetical protein [Acidaminobacter sp. JC074]
MNIGVLGVGVIGSSIIRGFCKDGDLDHVLYISPRGEEKSKSLEDEFSQVIRCKTNQEVLDKADLIIISVLPSKGMEILSSLSFSDKHHVINLMSDKKLDQIAGVIGKTQSLTHMVPLSFIQNRQGPIAVYPKNDFVSSVFSKMGHLLSVDKVEDIEAIAAITGLMTSYYRLLNDVTLWGQGAGLSYEVSKDYTTNFFEALSNNASISNLNQLSTEMTPGGLNEYALRYLEEKDTFKSWIDTLDPMLKRVE